MVAGRKGEPARTSQQENSVLETASGRLPTRHEGSRKGGQTVSDDVGKSFGIT